jgi:hypothetical protein
MLRYGFVADMKLKVVVFACKGSAWVKLKLHDDAPVP